MCIYCANLQAQQKFSVDHTGESLLKRYLDMDVENLWIAGHHIDWISGQPDLTYANAGIKTHCSAFVASACKSQNIYILRPPEHGQVLLANAQYNWLLSADAKTAGWHLISSDSTMGIYFAAQQYANKGFVVVAVYKNPTLRKPGHIAIVTPNETTTQLLTDNGPSIIMAGTHNYNLVSLKIGFKSHINQWPEPDILFYYN